MSLTRNNDIEPKLNVKKNKLLLILWKPLKLSKKIRHGYKTGKNLLIEKLNILKKKI